MSNDLLQRLREAERDPYAAVYDPQSRASLAGDAADEIERLNSLLATRTTAAEKMAPVQGYSPGIPWSMHLEAYDVYCKRYGKQQALIEGGCRGGFGTCELDMFIPGWRERLSEFNALKARIAQLEAGQQNRGADLQVEIDRLNAIINSPQANDFLRAVSTEAEHQRQRWGSGHDSGKTPADWFWLVGYLAGKALHAHAAGDAIKAEHHVITTAAALANWHLAMLGNTDMRPGTSQDE